MDIITALVTAKNTLNNVTVSGEQNLNYLLGTIQLLTKVIDAMQEAVKEKEGEKHEDSQAE